jgi:adenosine kinase
MARSHEARVQDVEAPIELGIVSSNGRRAMLEHARELKRRGIPTFVDPSHGLPILSREDLLELVEGAAGYFVNDYEWSLTREITGLSEQDLTARCDAVIVTRGPEGSEVRTPEQTLEIPVVKAERVVDPTGCGDAYRAGFLYAVAAGHGLDVAGRLGSVMGAAQVEVEGTQALEIDLAEVRRRYAACFGSDF